MKKLLFTRCLTYLSLVSSIIVGLGSSSLVLAGKLKEIDCKKVNFQVWNKLNEDVELTISTIMNSKNLFLFSGKISSNGVYNSNIKDLLYPSLKDDKPSNLIFHFNIGGKKKAWILTTKDWAFNRPGIYLRINEEKGNYKFGAQTGPTLGLGKTEAGCPVTKDVETKSVTPEDSMTQPDKTGVRSTVSPAKKADECKEKRDKIFFHNASPKKILFKGYAKGKLKDGRFTQWNMTNNEYRSVDPGMGAVASINDIYQALQQFNPIYIYLVVRIREDGSESGKNELVKYLRLKKEEHPNLGEKLEINGPWVFEYQGEMKFSKGKSWDGCKATEDVFEIVDETPQNRSLIAELTHG